jgi:PAS domain S-box-containing protein
MHRVDGTGEVMVPDKGYGALVVHEAEEVKPYSRLVEAGVLAVFLGGLYVTSLYSFMLFHSLTELIRIVIWVGIFVIAWNARRMLRNDFLPFLGIAYLCAGVVDLLHILSYAGIEGFKHLGPNLPEELWIAGRYLTAVSTFVAIAIAGRRLNLTRIFAIYVAITAALIALVFSTYFPDCYVEGKGPTQFDIASQRIITVLFLGAVVLLLVRKERFDAIVRGYLIAGYGVLVVSWGLFPFSLVDDSTLSIVRHLLRVLAFYLVYKGIIETSFSRPYSLIFKDLKDSEEALKAESAALEQRVVRQSEKLMATDQELWKEKVKRVVVEGALSATETKYQKLLETASDAIILVDAETGNILETNDRAVDLLAKPKSGIIGMHHSILHGSEEFVCPIEKLIQARGAEKFTYGEMELVGKDGGLVPVEVSASYTILGDKPVILSIVHDVSERKALEQQLLQSQKIEAIGRLAGGVAHDFNNLLTAVIGYSDRILSRLNQADPMYVEIEQIRQAGTMAANVAKQLLAFSRKQVLQPRTFSLNSAVNDIRAMIQRLLPEQIEVSFALAPELGNVKADPTQMEQVVLNLVINARDAMPEGGTLTIETDNAGLDENYARTHAEVVAGQYVVLAISDTGIGMDAETQKHLFEPFFTTKKHGEGTGLGLSTVYGIVKQSGGHVWVYSEVGKGTTFKLYLPRVEGVDEYVKIGPAPEQTVGGNETILLVEDEEIVRNLSALELEDLGYKVLKACSGENAVDVAERYENPIDLVVTDVVMPGMGGKALCEKLKHSRPEVKVLYVSGYTENAIAYQGVLEPGVAFLEKPFTPESLGRKIRQVLDEKKC